MRLPLNNCNQVILESSNVFNLCIFTAQTLSGVDQMMAMKIFKTDDSGKFNSLNDKVAIRLKSVN